jgi:outer membrane protein OmpA-like peptidoglycan-associated protein
LKKGILNIIFIIAPLFIFGQPKIKSFYFENSQSIPTEYSLIQLNLFRESYTQGEFTILEICSYTDSVGTSKYNDSLSKKRLIYVTTFLGINSNDAIQLNARGLTYKYDLTTFKSWRRVDIYYSLNEPNGQNDSSNQITEQLPPEIKDSIIEKPIVLSPIVLSPIDYSIKNSIPYILNIEFVEGKSKMKFQSHAEVRKLYEYLLVNPTVQVLVRGHVCCGNNMRISKRRAKSVYIELKRLGISKDRLDFVGLSNKEPLVFPEKTAADRQRNRRVDVVFSKIKE